MRDQRCLDACCSGPWNIAGLNASGGNGRFFGVLRTNNLKILDVDLFSIRQIIAEDGNYHFHEVLGDGNFNLFSFCNGHLVDAILLGDTRLSSRLKELTEAQQRCNEWLHAVEKGKDLRTLPETPF